MPQPDREFELKLDLTEEELERIASSRRLRTLKGGAKKILKSVYFDTPDHRLYAEGLVLRVRHSSDGFVQTVKLGEYGGDGVSHRVEVEDLLENAEPDPARIHDENVREMVLKATGGAAITRAFETNVTRTSYRLRTKSSVMELALDLGETRAGRGRSQICEAELELISGQPGDLLRTAQALFAETPIRPSPLTKAGRGYQLLKAHPAGMALEAARSGPQELAKGQSCGEAFALILRQTGMQIARNRAAVLKGADGEAVHQLRVGLTRLRAALKALETLAAFPGLVALEADAAGVSRAVGRLRDADVMIAHICEPVANACPDEAGLEGLGEALREHRKAALEEARAALEGGQWNRLLLSLTLWPAMLEQDAALAAPVDNYVDKLLNRRWKKAAKLGRRVESLNGEEQHKMRKSLKKLRYTAEFLAPLYPENKSGPFIRRLKRLQDVFGYVNDVRMAGALPEIVRQYSSAPEPLAAAGNALAFHEAKAAEAWRKAHKAWKRLKASGPFWK
jgi:triphosphatase